MKKINEVIEKPLDTIVSEIETILQPYRRELNIEIEKVNPKTIRITVEIKI